MSQAIGSAWQAEQTTVLLIDDDPDVLTFYQDVLTATGYRIETACDGNEAAYLVSSSAAASASSSRRRSAWCPLNRRSS